MLRLKRPNPSGTRSLATIMLAAAANTVEAEFPANRTALPLADCFAISNRVFLLALSAGLFYPARG